MQRATAPPGTTLLDGERALAHLDRLFRAALGFTRHHADAEDLVHDVIESLLRRPRRITAGSELGYLLTMIRNRHCDAVRARRRRPAQRPLEHALDAPAAPRGERPDERVEQREVLAAIAALRDDQRAVLVAVDVAGLSYADTATMLGVPVGTVMSRLSRARTAVARRCGRELADAAPAALR